MSASESETSGRIFISYRRQDSAYPAGWLYDRLADRFGADQVFKDVDSIELGDDFVETITNAVGSCDILLALIGKEWLDIAGSDGTRRLDDPDDFVRLEIEAALERKVLLIPILVEGALMPRGDQLPPSIAPMVRRQALELSPTRFRADTERLLDVMERTLADIQDEHEPAEAEAPVEAESPVEDEAPVEAEAPPPPAEPSPQPVEDEPEPERDRAVPWRLVLAGLAVAAVLAAVIVGIVKLVGDDPKKEPDSIDFSSPPAAATAPPKLGGSGAPVVLAHRGGDEKFALQTIPAYEHAAEIGAAVEMDVRWSKDGFPVLVHDKNTVPGMQCDGGGFTVKTATWDEMRDGCRSHPLTAGGKQYPIPLLDQAVAAVAKTPEAVIYPEIKVEQTGQQVRQFVTILKIPKMTGRTVVTSGVPGELGKIHEEAQNDGVNDLRLMQFVSERVPVENLEANLWGVAVRFDAASKAYVKELQDADLKVMVWNINTTAQWEDAVDAGADIVMTDKPKEFGDWFAGR